MAGETPRGPEEPLNTRARLAVPPQTIGEPSTRFANLALGLDAAFCNVVGLIFTLTGAFMADRLGIAGWILTLFGVFTLFWSFMVTLYANRRVSRAHEVTRVVRTNTVMVALGLIAMVVPSSMTRDGRVVLGGFLLVTGGFALAQVLARRTLDD